MELSNYTVQDLLAALKKYNDVNGEEYGKIVIYDDLSGWIERDDCLSVFEFGDEEDEFTLADFIEKYK